MLSSDWSSFLMSFHLISDRWVRRYVLFFGYFIIGLTSVQFYTIIIIPFAAFYFRCVSFVITFLKWTHIKLAFQLSNTSMFVKMTSVFGMCCCLADLNVRIKFKDYLFNPQLQVHEDLKVIFVFSGEMCSFLCRVSTNLTYPLYRNYQKVLYFNIFSPH